MAIFHPFRKVLSISNAFPPFIQLSSIQRVFIYQYLNVVYAIYPPFNKISSISVRCHQFINVSSIQRKFICCSVFHPSMMIHQRFIHSKTSDLFECCFLHLSSLQSVYRTLIHLSVVSSTYPDYIHVTKFHLTI